MATATEAGQRVLTALETIELMLGDLPEVAEGWERLGEGERVAWSVDWSNEMSKLERLAERAARGALTAAQYQRYRRLLQQVKDSLPILQRLNLYCPPLLLEA